MSLPTKEFSLDASARVRINQAGSVIAHGQFSAGADEAEIEPLLAKRRKLYIKPVRSEGDDNRPRLYILIGESGLTERDGMPVWEEYELVLDVGSNVQIFARRGPNVDTNVDVRVLEIGDG